MKVISALACPTNLGCNNHFPTKLMDSATKHTFIKKQLIASKEVFFQPNIIDCGQCLDVEAECSLDEAAAAIAAWRHPKLEFFERAPDPPYVQACINLYNSCILTLHASEMGCSHLLRLSGLQARPPSIKRSTTDPAVSKVVKNTTSQYGHDYHDSRSDIAENNSFDVPLMEGKSISKVWSRPPSPPKVWKEPLVNSRCSNLAKQVLQNKFSENEQTNRTFISDGRVMANLTEECNNRRIPNLKQPRRFKKNLKHSLEYLDYIPKEGDDDEDYELDDEKQGMNIPFFMSHLSYRAEGTLSNHIIRQMNMQIDEMGSNVNKFDLEGDLKPTVSTIERVACTRTSIGDCLREHSSTHERYNVAPLHNVAEALISSEAGFNYSSVSEVVKLSKKEILQVIGLNGLDIECISNQADCKIVLLPITNDMLHARGRDYESCHAFRLSGQPDQVARAKNLIRRALLEIRSK